MKLNQELIRKGFRIENGNLARYTIEGRKRKNWKASLRGKSQQFIKEKCEMCESNNNLTIHHKKLLSRNGSVSKENCQTLCRMCHDVVHFTPKKVKDAKYEEEKRKRKEKTKRRKETNEQEKKRFGILLIEEDEWGSYRIIN